MLCISHMIRRFLVEPIEYVYPDLSDTTAYSQSKQADMSASFTVRKHQGLIITWACWAKAQGPLTKFYGFRVEIAIK